jgi:predicted transcriptional regulator
MHDHGTPSGVAVQRAVLSLVLDAHPKLLTIPDLARELGTQDAVERAVAELVSVGLLAREGNAVSPTAAARRFDQLELP